ncbi:MAG: hypothetical protein JXB38_03985 [Anaerolineales bacterium]|nr:hypothetical protein [Anaerolineales bacterium]
MLALISWYLLLSLLGLLAFPLAYRLLSGLPDRGYAVSRTLGLLLWGFIFWLLTSLGLLVNNPGGIVFALILVLALSAWALRGGGLAELRAWLRENRRVVLGVEMLFPVALIFIAILRGTNPGVLGTEKPMELAFINSVLRSPQMPPSDPWLSGYGISYYYFGYVMVGMLAQLTGVSGGVAFNLGTVMVFALAAVGAYGVIFNLLETLKARSKGNPALATLGPVFVLLVGNVEGFLEILHARHAFWQGTFPNLTSRFWTWLDMVELSEPPTSPPQWVPRLFGIGSWWWWRASRVIQDYDMVGSHKEVIDEFPAFSYLLGDLHPHVLAMPFAFLTIALALNLFLQNERGQFTLFQRLEVHISMEHFALAAIAFGGLAFLNFWDFPVYVGLYAGAYALREGREHGWDWQRLWEFLGIGILLGAGGYLLYLPFHLSFSSQAGGILPNIIYASRGVHFWVMWGTLLLPIFVYLGYLAVKRKTGYTIFNGVWVGFGIVLALGLLAVLWATIITRLVPALTFIDPQASIAGNAYLSSVAAPNLGALLAEGMLRRFSRAGTWITLALVFGLAIGLQWPFKREVTKRETAAEGQAKLLSPAHAFAGLLVLFGALVVTVPDFFFLRDFFGYRINSVFKFYYQGWFFWALGAAFGSAYLLSKLRGVPAIIFDAFLIFVLLVGMTYMVYGFADTIASYQRNPNAQMTLDGTRDSSYLSPDDVIAVQWLQRAPRGVLAEAVGGSYTQYARISTHSGQVAVLGWEFHEVQWRGGSTEMGSRSSDIRSLYETSNWESAKGIIDMYDIRYIYVGTLEQNAYNVNPRKFDQNLIPVIQLDTVTVYEVP